MSDLTTIDQILKTWLTKRGVGDNAVFEPWLATMSLLPLDKDAFLIRAGEHSRYLYFIEQGLLRLYYISAEGKERNKAFYGRGRSPVP